jgi:hypothetical protein
MKYARIHCERDSTPSGLEELLANAELDLLQLDYTRPRQTPVVGKEPVELPLFAAGFAETLRSLGKALFLRPEFRIVASPGWESSFQCVERAAVQLVEAGCGDVPVAAVRGSNLLPIMEMLQAQQIELRHEETQAPLRELRAPLLAADLQIGAGPFAIAWDEAARVIVSGCYDLSSPLTGAAAAEFDWLWSAADKLAATAVAARAAEWCDWQATDLDSGSLGRLSELPTLDLTASGEVHLHTARSDNSAAGRLQSWLRSYGRGSQADLHADVRLDAGSVICTAANAHQIAIEGAKGRPSDNHWRLDILYLAGYALEVMIEFTPEAPAGLRRQMAAIARSHLGVENLGGLFAVQELHGAGEAGAPSWLHIHYQSKNRAACQQVLEQVVRLTSMRGQYTRLASGPPTVMAQCGVWPTRVPRDAVDIAVETRLAREWI